MIRRKVTFTVGLLTFAFAISNAKADPFQNLDFEASPYPGNAGFSLSEPASVLFPDWTLRFGDVIQTTASLNATQLAGPRAALYTSDVPSLNVLEGTHSAYLGAWFGLTGVSLSQSGDVPAGTQSVRFHARNVPYSSFLLPPGPFDLQMDGQSVPLVTLFSDGPDLLLGADISAWAETSAELRIIVLTPASQSQLGFANIDAISFSPLPLPEPASLGALLLWGLTALGRRAR